MALPTLPGKSWAEMKELVIRNHGIPYVFSWELVLAICWEESKFNNIEQVGGSAWGFGQVEPAEFRKFETDEAKQLGYYVPGLPRRTTVGNQTKLLGTLTDDQSVKVVSSALRHNYHHLSQSKQNALYAYAGVFFTGKSPLSKADRIALVNGWLECEKHLQFFHQGYDPNEIVKGLKKARTFDAAAEAEYRKVLFPFGEDRFLQDLKKYIDQLSASNALLRFGSSNSEVVALQQELNFKGDSAYAKLVPDGAFGNKTRTRVVEFQQKSGLVPDSVVGPMTKRKLVG